MFAHGFTYCGHPVCCAVALETLAIYEERDILGHVRAGRAGAAGRACGALPTIRWSARCAASGLLAAIELVRDKAAKAPFPAAGAAPARSSRRNARTHGLILRAIGDTIAFCPPLVITADEIDELLARFAARASTPPPTSLATRGDGMST